MYSDTLFATTMSRRGNRCTQIFATNFGCSLSFPMKLKNEAHKELTLLFQQEGVPSVAICDNDKEMVLGEFNRKLKEALHLKQTEPFTPWLNAPERKIKELKKCSGRKFIKSGTPNRLWDDCLELEFYIRSNTAHGLYKLVLEVPETIMSSATSDISQFCWLEWFKWVMFQDKTATYPNEHFKLDRYLGLSIDIGLALMAKIIKEDGQVLHRSMY